MIRRLPSRPLLTLILAGALLAVSAPSAGAAWLRPKWPGAAGGVFRSADLVKGQSIYTNGIGQALGADADATKRTEYFRWITWPQRLDDGFKRRDLYLALTYDLFGVHRAAHNGDYVLPTDTTAYSDFTGEIAEAFRCR